MKKSVNLNHKIILPLLCAVMSLSFCVSLTWRILGMLFNKPVPMENYTIAYPHNYTYVLNEPDKCRGSAPFLVLMIPVAPHDRPARDAIRETWGQENCVPGVAILRIFVLGLSWGHQASKIQAELGRESREHRDIIQKDFLDSYRNLTIKTMVMLDWLATYCPRASYTMKIDTDMFLNVDNLVNKLLDPSALHLKQDYITGPVIGYGIIRRDQESKWYMPFEVFGGVFYPPYISGIGYVFSVDLVPKILRMSKFIRPVFLEDVYIGMCLQELGVKLTYAADSRYFPRFSVSYNPCSFSQLISTTLAHPHQLPEVWHDFQRTKFAC
ncbi:beta-1,3-galactosyltransferase 2 [Amia ocellicauda]|uniref:beta-1,3-galactosyltransferase 2 n=1 Tax=Amia ocellicauda TaxID=2972642 RepID=UPI00346418C6